jgi:hypothetical protein
VPDAGGWNARYHDFFYCWFLGAQQRLLLSSVFVKRLPYRHFKVGDRCILSAFSSRVLSFSLEPADVQKLTLVSAGVLAVLSGVTEWAWARQKRLQETPLTLRNG